MTQIGLANIRESDEFVSDDMLADWLQLTVQRVHQLVKEKVLPDHVRGQFPLRTCIQAYIVYLRKKAAGSGTLELAQARARRELAKAELAELELQEKKENLLPADQVKRASFEHGRAIREALDRIPPRISSQLAAETEEHTIEQILQREFRHIPVEPTP